MRTARSASFRLFAGEAAACPVQPSSKRSPVWSIEATRKSFYPGIHLGTYGRDLNPKTSLQALIEDILETVPTLQRLRLSSIEPLEVTPEIIALVAANPRMAHHFHVPLQSGSSRVLRAMRRPYQPEYYADLLHRIRSQVDDAAIGADVMVAFPGETDEEFSETFRLIEDTPLTYLHVFPYSARPGTPAADLTAQVPPHVSSFRARACGS